jgi:hypothetical protein
MGWQRDKASSALARSGSPSYGLLDRFLGVVPTQLACALTAGLRAMLCCVRFPSSRGRAAATMTSVSWSISDD